MMQRFNQSLLHGVQNIGRQTARLNGQAKLPVENADLFECGHDW
jgi:hypothetical protein